MQKIAVAELISASTNLSRSQAITALDGFIKVATDVLAQGKDITLRGFGTLKVVAVAERQGRNISTGEAVTIPAHKAVRLVAGKELKNAVNS